MKKWTLVFCAAGLLLAVVLLVFRSAENTGTPIAPATNSSGPKPSAIPTASPVPVASTNLVKLLTVISNASKTAEGMTASYEAREIIADRLRTNEQFRLWATNEVRTAVQHLVQARKIRVYGTRNLTTNDLTIDVDVKPVGGLWGVATYDPDTNSEGPLYFNVEGGTNPVIGLVQNPYRMANYQLDPQHWGPRDIGQMDWSGATTPLDAGYVRAIAQEAYMEMTDSQLPANWVFQSDTSAVTDRTVQDPSVVVTGRPGATVATAVNQRFPFALFSFTDPTTGSAPFNGELVQTQPGQAEIVKLFYSQNFQESVVELGEQFLGANSPDWAQDVLGNIGSTPPEEVLKRLWNIPNR